MTNKTVVNVKRHHISVTLFYSVVFIAMFVLFFMVPYSWDEWAWGTHERLAVARNLFQGYNGRYFGDVLSLGITRSNLFKTLVMSGCFTALLGAISSLVGHSMSEKHRNILRISILFLMLVIPVSMFAQTYGWPAAFVNFIPPVIAIVWLFNFQSRYVNEEINNRQALVAGVLITVGTQFFSENVSIYINILAVMFIAQYWFQKHRVSVYGLSVLAVSFVFTIIMFANPAYSNAAKGAGTYKRIKTGVSFFISKINDVMIPGMISNNIIVILMISGVVLFLAIKSKRITGFIQGYIVSSVIAYPVYMMLLRGHFTIGRETANDVLGIVFTIAFYVGIFLFVAFNYQENDLWQRMMVLLSVGFISAPLLMAEPIGPRVFYPTYILWTMFAALLFKDLLTLYPSEAFDEVMLRVSKVGSVTFVVLYILIFSYQYYGGINRQRMINSAIDNNAKVLRLPNLPNTTFVRQTSSNDPVWNRLFKEFYHIPQKIKVIFPGDPDY